MSSFYGKNRNSIFHHGDIFRSGIGNIPYKFGTLIDGTWLDLSDDRVKFQTDVDADRADSAGDTIGLIYDKHTGTIIFGPELITNGTFDTDTTGWTGNNADLSVVSSRLRVKNNSAAKGNASDPYTTIVGKTYRASIDFVKNGVNGSLHIGTTAGGSEVFNGSALTSTQTQVITFIATATTTYIGLVVETTVDNDEADFDNISVKEYAGNPALQATSSKRPIFQVSGTIKSVAFDEVDDLLNVEFQNLGSSCTVATLYPGEVQIDEGQTISGTHALPATEWLQHLVVDQAMTLGQVNKMVNYFSTKSDVNFAVFRNRMQVICNSAVDVFIYDTQKDSDAGAAVALGSIMMIVANAANVKIYDGADPDLPLLKTYDFTGFTVSSCFAAQQYLVVGTEQGVAKLDIDNFEFILDFHSADKGR